MGRLLAKTPPAEAKKHSPRMRTPGSSVSRLSSAQRSESRGLVHAESAPGALLVDSARSTPKLPQLGNEARKLSSCHSVEIRHQRKQDADRFHTTYRAMSHQ